MVQIPIGYVGVVISFVGMGVSIGSNYRSKL